MLMYMRIQIVGVNHKANILNLDPGFLKSFPSRTLDWIFI